MRSFVMGKPYIVVMFSLMLFFGCTEVYHPGIEVGDSIIYVEGAITDTPGVHKIILRNTSSYNEKANFSPVTGAIVSIRDNDSFTYMCIETSEGVYVTDSSFFCQEGHTYTLRIESSNGNIFESKPQLLPEENVPINSIYGMNETRAIDYYNNYGEYIVMYKDVNQIYADMPSGNKNAYYRFETQATIELATRLKMKNGSEIDLVPLYQWNSYMSDDISVIEVNTQLDIISRIKISHLDTDPEVFSELKYQYEDDIVDEYHNRITDTVLVEVETDTGLVLVDSIVYGLSPEVDDFDILNGWILQIQQYSISKDAYIFWSDVKKLEEISGEIFDPIATQLRGNMYCLNDESIEILGLFEVASKIVTPAFINFYSSGDGFQGAMLEKDLEVPYRGWKDSIPPVFWVDKIQVSAE